MTFQKHELFTEINGCKSLTRLYSEKNQLKDVSILLIHGAEMEDESDSMVTSWIMGSDFITVFAAEDITKFSYNFLSQFDVRLSSVEYPASCVIADERYRLLCGDTAYELLKNGKTESATNFVTVLSAEETFSEQAQAYVRRVCGDKTQAQIKVLTKCLRSAVRGGTEAVLAAESEGFYALMAQKTEDASNE